MRKTDNKTAAVDIIQTLRARGHQAYLVGGCVRDMLLGRKSPKEEHDVATSARTQEVVKLFPKTLLVGAKFGVVLVGRGGHWIEVASFRCDEGYSDGRHPDRVRIGSIEEDAQRRDFTMNGLYYDPIDEKIIDLVAGRTDIEKRVIRAIGQPEARFREDHLRMFRAVRFAGQLENFHIEEQTAHALVKLVDQIVNISDERILEELKKLLAAPGRVHGLRLADELGLLKFILPPVHQLHQATAKSFTPGFTSDGLGADAFEQTLAVLTQLPPETPFEVSLAGLLHLAAGSAPVQSFPIRHRMSSHHYHPAAKIADQICRALTCSNQERMTVVWLVHLLPLFGLAPQITLAQIKRLMLYHRFENLLTLYRARVQATMEPRENLRQIETLATRVDPVLLGQPPLITGDDLTRALGLSPGPAFQKILDEIYDAQLNEEIKTKAEAIDRAERIAAK